MQIDWLSSSFRLMPATSKGRINGWVTDTVAGGFLLDLAVSKARRGKLADTLSWLDKQQRYDHPGVSSKPPDFRCPTFTNVAPHNR